VQVPPPEPTVSTIIFNIAKYKNVISRYYPFTRIIAGLAKIGRRGHLAKPVVECLISVVAQYFFIYINIGIASVIWKSFFCTIS